MDMKGLKGILLILGFWLLGEVVSWLIDGFVPGNVIGMVLLFCALQTNLVKEKSVAKISTFLTKNMAIMFLPPGVGLIVAYPILRDHWITLTLATVLSTMIVMLVVGKLQDHFGKPENDTDDETNN